MLLKLITLENVIFSAVLAFFVTYGVLRAADFVKIYKERKERKYSSFEFDEAINRCYALFPIDSYTIQGFMLERGMKVRIITNQNKIFEGKFLGANKDNMVCLMTKKFIIAHAMQNIEYIEKLD